MFLIGGREVSTEAPTLILAEIGSAHGGSIDTAERLIDIAARAGCDGVKFQIRTNDELFTKAYLERPYNSENAFGDTYGEHRRALELDQTELDHLHAYANSRGLVCFATAFDASAVEMCVRLGYPAIKLASGSLTNTPLLSFAASTNLPIFLSTGAGTLEDVDRAVDTITSVNPRLALLQCTASYPTTDYSTLDLGVIQTYAERYPCVPGVSLHVSGIAMGPVSVALGARVIEMHITYDRAAKGTDHSFSLEPNGLRRLVRDVRRTEVAMGTEKRFHESETDAFVKMSQSIVAARPLKAGQVIRGLDLALKTPGGGLAPYRFKDLVGKRINRNLKTDEMLEERDVTHKVKA